MPFTKHQKLQDFIWCLLENREEISIILFPQRERIETFGQSIYLCIASFVTSNTKANIPSKYTLYSGFTLFVTAVSNILTMETGRIIEWVLAVWSNWIYQIKFKTNIWTSKIPCCGFFEELTKFVIPIVLRFDCNDKYLCKGYVLLR